MSLIEKYRNTDKGYHPFLIRPGWQIAQLNYTEEQHIDNIRRLDVHRQTDEAFWLQKGKVVLITAELDDKEFSFSAELMYPGTIYNIPKNTLHNIAMTPGSEVIIVEKSNTHLDDFEFNYLNDSQCLKLKEAVLKAFDDVKLVK